MKREYRDPATADARKIKKCSEEPFRIDVIRRIFFFSGHECDKNALVLAEGSGGLPGSDGSGAGGFFVGFRVGRLRKGYAGPS